MGVEVRSARDDELAAAGALMVAGYDADGYLVRPNGTYDDLYAGWLADTASRGADGSLLVAVEGDRMLGAVTWCPPGSPARELATEPHQGEFRTLAVDPAARGRGVGRALVEACFDRARQLGMTEMIICSLTDMVPAHRLYTSLGFVRRPELDWSPAEGIDLLAFSAVV